MDRSDSLEISTVGYPPYRIRNEINALREDLAERFSSKNALSWEPHITLAHRVLIPGDKLEGRLTDIKTLCRITKPIRIRTVDLELFEIKGTSLKHPYAIVLEVEVSDALRAVNEKINKEIYEGLERPSMKDETYRPHITLAYRDLTKENYLKAIDFFRDNPINSRFKFELDNLVLIRHETHDLVEEFRKFRFEG